MLSLKKKSFEKGFTLIELMVVVAIVGVGFSFFMPGDKRNAQEILEQSIVAKAEVLAQTPEFQNMTKDQKLATYDQNIALLVQAQKDLDESQSIAIGDDQKGATYYAKKGTLAAVGVVSTAIGINTTSWMMANIAQDQRGLYQPNLKTRIKTAAGSSFPLIVIVAAAYYFAGEALLAAGNSTIKVTKEEMIVVQAKIAQSIADLTREREALAASNDE